MTAALPAEERQRIEDAYLRELALTVESLSGYQSPEQILTTLEALEQIAFVLRQAGKSGPTLSSLLTVLGCAAVARLVYALTLPRWVQLLEQRREFVLRAVTRE